jgi:DMSO/TMAO reductase YedYZ molybdopterin-dependent catalytic subunit
MKLPFVNPDRPPPGPFRPGFWRSPLRGPWLTSLFGFALLIAIPIVAITGFLSNAAYDPRLGHNSAGRHLGPLDFYLFPWPTHPSWIYALTQGLHVTIGLAATPILLAKLWSVIPKLFAWPPAKDLAQAVERLSLALLVGSALFEFATGILDIQYSYLFKFVFLDAHYYGAWIFSAAFVFHASIKLGTMRSSLATRRALTPLMDDLAHTLPEPVPAQGSELIASAPEPPTMSRRTLVGTVGFGSLLLLIQGAGDSLGGPLRSLAFLGPRDRHGGGPNGFAINRTAQAASISAADVGSGWMLQLEGPHTKMNVSRAQLQAMPQHSYDLPIACVEGWSTTQHWTGVRVRDLAAAVGMGGQATVLSKSLEQGGVFSSATLAANEVSDDRTLLALQVNGVDLSLDHGFPARIIAPGVPGVHCTKWVSKMTFQAA